MVVDATHGLATLLIDGRLGPLSAKVPGGDVEGLIDAVLTRFVRGEPRVT